MKNNKLKNMAKYCNQCGAEISDEDEFCNNCGRSLAGAPQAKSNFSHNKIIIILLGVIIALLVLSIMFMNFGNIFSPKEATTIDIETGSQISAGDNFKVRLSGENGGVSGRLVKITFSNSNNNYEFSATTDQNGYAMFSPTVDLGDYEVTCEFEGDDEYSSTSSTSHVNIKEAEPNYESYYYFHSFEDTDKDGDGFVTLSDMNIAHTPKNIQNQMYSDSDDDGDGKLNRHEYYKFMYKLNYDYHRYGL